MALRNERRSHIGTRPWGRHATEAAAGVGLLGLSLLVLSDRADAVPGWEIDAFEAVNGLPDSLRWPLWPVMQLGNFWMVVVGRRRRVRRHPAAASGAGRVDRGAPGLGGGQAGEAAVERGRPGDLLDGVEIREAGLHGHGYVSGHTAIAFAVATVLTPLLPGRWRLVPFALAALVGLARIYYGAHLPLDVVGGAGLGILCGLVASLAVRHRRPGARPLTALPHIAPDAGDVPPRWCCGPGGGSGRPPTCCGCCSAWRCWAPGLLAATVARNTVGGVGGRHRRGLRPRSPTGIAEVLTAVAFVLAAAVPLLADPGAGGPPPLPAGARAAARQPLAGWAMIAPRPACWPTGAWSSGCGTRPAATSSSPTPASPPPR